MKTSPLALLTDLKLSGALDALQAALQVRDCDNTRFDDGRKYLGQIIVCEVFAIYRVDEPMRCREPVEAVDQVLVDDLSHLCTLSEVSG